MFAAQLPPLGMQPSGAASLPPESAELPPSTPLSLLVDDFCSELQPASASIPRTRPTPNCSFMVRSYLSSRPKCALFASRASTPRGFGTSTAKAPHDHRSWKQGPERTSLSDRGRARRDNREWPGSLFVDLARRAALTRPSVRGRATPWCGRRRARAARCRARSLRRSSEASLRDRCGGGAERSRGTTRRGPSRRSPAPALPRAPLRLLRPPSPPMVAVRCREVANIHGKIRQLFSFSLIGRRPFDPR